MSNERGGHSAGWYQDPEKEGHLRYWDGRGWTSGSARVIHDSVDQRPSHGGLYAFILFAVVSTAFILGTVAWTHRHVGATTAPVNAATLPIHEAVGPGQAVYISKCQMGDLNGVSIEARITNLGRKTAAFLVSVNLEDDQSVVIGSGSNGSPYLAPNQTGYIEIDAIARSSLAHFRCVVANVQRRTATP